MKPHIYFDGEKWCFSVSNKETRAYMPRTRAAAFCRYMNERRAMAYFTK